jgi:hypothetical protein
MAYCQCLSPEPVDLRLPIGVLNRAGRFYRISTRPVEVRRFDQR